MEVNYKRDSNHNYLILSGAENIDTESYQMRLLMASAPAGLLKCIIHTIDNQLQFYYDITSMHTVFELYEHKKMNKADIQLLFGEIITVLEELEGFLLNCGYLLLQAEYIYLDSDKKQVNFCYFPGKTGDMALMFRELAEYLLPKIDHTDQAAVMLGYSIYRKAMADSMYLEQIKGELYREYQELPKKNKEMSAAEAAVLEEQYLSEDPGSYNFEEAAENSGYPAVPTIAIVIAGVVFWGYFYFLNRTVYSWKVYAAAAIALVILGIIPGAVYLIRSYCTNRKQQKNEQQTSSMPQADITENDTAFWEQEDYPEQSAAAADSGATVVLAPSPADQQPCLVAVYPAILQPIVINTEVLILGKLESAADAVLPSPAVSRIHAKIVKQDGCTVYDLNSRNGTRVNQKLLIGNEGYKLQEGDEISFGDLTYSFRMKI